MAPQSRIQSRRQDLDPAAAVEQVVRRLRNDCTEARFQVSATEADLRRLEEQAAAAPAGGEWSAEIVTYGEQVSDLRRDLGRLERKTEEAETYAGSLSARASSIRARLSLTEFLAELETGDAVELFDRLRGAVRQLEFEAKGLLEVEDLLD